MRGARPDHAPRRSAGEQAEEVAINGEVAGSWKRRLERTRITLNVRGERLSPPYGVRYDPRYGPALGLAAQCCQHLVANFNAPDRDVLRSKGIDFGRRAVEVAGDDPGILADAAMALAVLGEDLDAMIALVDRALAFNPSYARGWLISGFMRLWAGQTDHAIEHGQLALRLSPRAQAGDKTFLIGTALFFGRHFEEAVPRLWVAIEAMPAYPNPYRYLAACYAHMGLLEEAHATIMRLRAICLR
jgi:tetratricopeptide (TPR) repeat protein